MERDNDMENNDEERRRARREAGKRRRRSRAFRRVILAALILAFCGALIFAGMSLLRGRTQQPEESGIATTQTEEPAPQTAAPTETAAPETTAPPESTAPSETTGLSAESDPRSAYAVAYATIAATGDILPHIPIINAARQGDMYDFRSVFAYFTSYVSAADFAVANLETTLAGTENGDKYSGYPRFNSPDEIADALKDAGFDMILTANNHAYDTGEYGLMRTQQVLADRGLLHLGTVPEADDLPYTVQEISGIKIGMVCYTYGEISDSTGQKSVNGLPMTSEASACINVFDYEKLQSFYREAEELIAEMRADGAEALVLFIHWGNEYELAANSYQTTIAQKMCDLGFDVIVGGHPHVIEPVELLTSTTDAEHKTLCVYSVGNALSNQRRSNMELETGHTEDGMLLQFTFVKYTDGKVYLDSAEILPTWVYVGRSDGKRIYRILPLDKSVTDWGEAFGIGGDGVSDAEASYERTLALVGSGMEEADAYLTESRAEREEAYAAADIGVG